MRTIRFALVAVAAAIPLLAEAQGAGGTTPPAAPGVERRDERPPVGRGMREGRGMRGRRGGPEAEERRAAMRAQWEAMSPAEREAAIARVRERRAANATPEQRARMARQRAAREGTRAKAQALRAQVDAGTLTREQAAEQLRAYREANRPPRPAPPR